MIPIDGKYDCNQVAETFCKLGQSLDVGAYVVDHNGVEWLYVGYRQEGKCLQHLLIAGASKRSGSVVRQEPGIKLLECNVSEMAQILVEFEQVKDQIVQRVSLRLPSGQPVIYG